MSSNHSDIRQGDIFWIEVPGTTGSEQSGRRPYIIMSRLAVHRSLPTIVGVPMSTRVHKANAHRILLPASEIIRDPSCMSQVQDSVALCDHVRVIDKSLLNGKIGRLSQTAIISVGLGLAFLFDLR